MRTDMRVSDKLYFDMRSRSRDVFAIFYAMFGERLFLSQPVSWIYLQLSAVSPRNGS